jgi:D-serine deaminase-like pyridoxal phosphate-dependent protein
MMTICEIETPAVVIDLDVMEANLRRMSDYAHRHDLKLRPHTKTHKIPQLARRQLDLGAAGLTVAKVGEAEVMLAAGPPNLLVEYPIVGRAKIERLAEVGRHTPVCVALDTAEAAEQLSSVGVDFGVLAEVDVGLGRVGVQPGEKLRELLRRITSLPHLQFEGVSFFPGHICSGDEAGMAKLAQVGRLIERILDDVQAEGLKAAVVSGGNTPTAFHSHMLPGLTEIRAGTYIFNDRNTVFSGACGYEDCAASVLATVVSNAVPGQVIIDAGSKAFSSDSYWGPQPSFGHVLEAPQAVFTKMNEEHGFVDIRQTGRTFHVGERLRVIPNHICPAINLQNQVFGLRGGRVEQLWDVAARGKLQ